MAVVAFVWCQQRLAKNLQKSEIWYDFKWKNGPRSNFFWIFLFSLFSFDSRWDSMLNKITILFHLTMEWDNILRSSDRGLLGRAAELLSIVFHLTTLFLSTFFSTASSYKRSDGWWPSPVCARKMYSIPSQSNFFSQLLSLVRYLGERAA